MGQLFSKRKCENNDRREVQRPFIEVSEWVTHFFFTLQVTTKTEIALNSIIIQQKKVPNFRFGEKCATIDC